MENALERRKILSTTLPSGLLNWLTEEGRSPGGQFDCEPTRAPCLVLGLRYWVRVEPSSGLAVRCVSYSFISLGTMLQNRLPSHPVAPLTDRVA